MLLVKRNLQNFTTGIFCEPFSAGNAIAALMESGFSEMDIQAIGVLEGHGRATEELLLTSGIPSADATLYSELFEDGALLVMVRLDEEGTNSQVATDVLKKHGGVHTRSQTLCPQNDCVVRPFACETSEGATDGALGETA